MDRAESSAVKVMIYLIEGVLPEGYFADNLRGLSVDMAVFRDLLRSRLPKLSKHLEALQSDAKDKATGKYRLDKANMRERERKKRDKSGWEKYKKYKKSRGRAN